MKRYMSMMLAFVPLLLLAACGGGYGSSGGGGYGSSSGAPPATSTGLKLVSNAKYGSILADGNGRTLYLFTQDVPAGGGNPAVSNCTTAAACLQLWPIFHSQNPALGAGLDAADVGQITRSDGLPQTTYKGFPIYYFSGDASPGDANGESIADWFVVRNPFYSVVTLHGAALRLTDAGGRTLYTFALDTAGPQPASACDTNCTATWPIFLATDAVVTPTTLDGAQLITFARADNRKQTAYKGHPLYHFSGDAAPGDAKGLAVPPVGSWSTLDPSKQ